LPVEGFVLGLSEESQAGTPFNMFSLFSSLTVCSLVFVPDGEVVDGGVLMPIPIEFCPFFERPLFSLSFVFGSPALVGGANPGRIGDAGGSFVGLGVAEAGFFSGSFIPSIRGTIGAAACLPGAFSVAFSAVGASSLVELNIGWFRILSPITAPARHRNVQVMPIPILCSWVICDSSRPRERPRLATLRGSVPKHVSVKRR
jgi:hypothetical protein